MRAVVTTWNLHDIYGLSNLVVKSNRKDLDTNNPLIDF